MGFRRWAPLLLAAATAGAAPAEPGAGELVGAYSNMVVTQGNAQGNTVQLWRDGDLYYGLLLHAEGLATDIPVGLLEDLRVDRDKTISFKARLSVGVVTVSGDEWVPSRDVYQFKGTLFPDQMQGELVHADLLNPNRPATHETVKLYRTSKYEESMKEAPTSYDAWARWAEGVLQNRGPKW